MAQEVPNMAPKSNQVGAMLGSKIALDAPKSEQKTTPKAAPKKHSERTYIGVPRGCRIEGTAAEGRTSGALAPMHFSTKIVTTLWENIISAKYAFPAPLGEGNY